jgi:hypothetical protein
MEKWIAEWLFAPALYDLPENIIMGKSAAAPGRYGPDR